MSPESPTDEKSSPISDTQSSKSYSDSSSDSGYDESSNPGAEKDSNNPTPAVPASTYKKDEATSKSYLEKCDLSISPIAVGGN